MRTVYRYTIEISDVPTSITMPEKAKLLAVDQSEKPFGSIDLWAEVETANPPVNRSFVVKGTGHAIGSPRLHYVGTAIQTGIPKYVWHVYEVV